jgi:hypothetical protein
MVSCLQSQKAAAAHLARKMFDDEAKERRKRKPDSAMENFP